MKEADTFVIPESECDFRLDARTVLVVSGEPFLSVHQIAKKVILSKSMCRHLMQTMRWKLRHLKKLPTV
jgi:hypothetical protein